MNIKQARSTQTSKMKSMVVPTVLIILMTGCHSPKHWFIKQWIEPPLMSEKNLRQLATGSTNQFTNLIQVVQYVLQDTNSTSRATRRNEVLYDLIRISNERYNAFKAQVFFNNSFWNSGIDVTSLGLSAAATIVAGPAAQAMSAADTGIKGVQSKVAERWLQNQTMIVLLVSMDSARAEESKNIYHMMTNTYDKFPIQEGLRMVEDYHQKASLISAMENLQSTIGEAKTTNKAASAKAESQK